MRPDLGLPSGLWTNLWTKGSGASIEGPNAIEPIGSKHITDLNSFRTGLRYLAFKLWTKWGCYFL